MMKYNNKEFENIVNEYITHPEVCKMKKYAHHGINRFEHSYRVAYHTYKVTKFLHLDYISSTKAAMLHDFFLDEVSDEGAIAKLRRHPNAAVDNSKKYFGLTDKEEDIIRTHMFPITFRPPKYLESWIVDVIDDYSSIYERGISTTKSIKASVNFGIIILVTIFKSII